MIPLLIQSRLRSESALNGELVWGAPQWFVPTIVVLIVVVLFVIWSYCVRPVPTWVRVLGMALKVAAVVLLAICLLQPMRSGTRPEPMSNILAILTDTSASMNVSPKVGGESRATRVGRLLERDNAWREELGKLFEMRSYRFDSRLDSTSEDEVLMSDGDSSLLATSLKGLSQRLAGRPIAGVMVFSDGIATDLDEFPTDWSQLGCPIYPVIASDEQGLADLSFDSISVSQSDFESAPVTIDAAVKAVGMDSRNARVELRDLATNKLIEQQTVSISANEAPASVRFRFRPESGNVSFYRMRITDAADSDDDTSSQVEATRINNERLLAVRKNHGPYRILYVAGRPNWEYKFIRRALDADEEIQLVGLLRIANKEPKFSFRDATLNSTNPLFAGLGDEEEAAEQYDEPVILRLGIQESEELSKGFPTTAEELFAYHGVILDDIETEFFTQDQMLLLQRFVAERGGGMLMLGGQESFRGDDFANSPLGDLSPVYTAPRDGRSGEEALRFELTREGMLQAWARLRETESAESTRLKSIAPLRTASTVGGVKPGASILARATAEDGKSVPALVVQRFGNGRTVAVPLGDLWRWSMRRNQDDRDDPEQAWRQWMRWLVGEVPKRTEMTVDPSRDASKPTTISVVVRDEMFRPMDNADVQLEIQPLSGEGTTIKATADPNRAGYYIADYWTKQTDAFRVAAKVTSSDGAELPGDTTGWVSEPSAAEFEQLQTNRALLEQMAEQSGGRVVMDDELDAFAAELPHQKVPVSQAWVYPIWHRPWVMLLALVCLCSEWGLRRWKGLA